MKISAFDLGTKLGWATDVTGRLEWGEQDFSLKRGESPGMRFHAFNQWLFEIAGGREMSMWSVFSGENHPEHKEPFQTAPELIVYELPHLRGGAATDVLVGFATRIHEYCAVWSKCRPMDYAAVHSATLKKFATGNGRDGWARSGLKRLAAAQAVQQSALTKREQTAGRRVRVGRHPNAAVQLGTCPRAVAYLVMREEKGRTT